MIVASGFASLNTSVSLSGVSTLFTGAAGLRLLSTFAPLGLTRANLL